MPMGPDTLRSAVPFSSAAEVELHEWPLTGRDRELAAITASLGRSGSGGLILTGAPGVGKSRLALEAARLAHSWDWSVRTVVASSAASGIPFGAFAALRVPSPAVRNRFELLQQMARALLDHAAERPLLIAVDDAHFLDPSSAALVHHLVTATPAFVLCTVRAGPPAPEALFSLWKDGHAARMEIEPLDRDHLAGLLTAVLGAPPDTLTERELWRLTQGNVLYLREVVLAALRGGTLVRADDRWRWTGALPVSGRLAEVVGVRLGHLSGASRRLAELLALAEPLDQGSLRLLCTPGTLMQAESRGRVVVSDGGRTVRLAHPLYGEVLRAAIPQLRAQRLLGDVADALDTSPDRGQLLRSIMCRLQAGQIPAANHLTLAAEQALAVFDNTLAERLARLALREAGAGFAAGLALAGALTGQGRASEAEEVLLGMTGQVSTDEDMVALATLRAPNLWSGLGRAEEARRVLVEAASAVSTSAGLAQLTAVSDTMEMSFARVLVESTTLRPSSGAATDDSPFTRILQCIRSYLGARPEQALREIERLAQEPSRVDQVMSWAPPNPLESCRCPGLYYAGRLAEAHELAIRGYAEARAAAVASTQGVWCYYRGIVYLFEGKPSSAIPVLAEGADLLQTYDPFWMRPNCLGVLAQAAAVVGATYQAEHALAQIELIPGQLESARSVVAQARAWLTAAAGRRREACRLLVARARADDSVGLRTVAIHLLHDAVRLGESSCADYLTELAADADGDLLPLFAAHGRALRMRRGDALALISERFEGIGAILYAAEAAARAAVRHRRASRDREALAQERRASQLVRRCEGARTPALSLLTPPRALSPREAEVARLVARGLTSREVAGRLSVSVRTVDNQLASIYSKLGIGGRSELGVALFNTP